MKLIAVYNTITTGPEFFVLDVGDACTHIKGSYFAHYFKKSCGQGIHAKAIDINVFQLRENCVFHLVLFRGQRFSVCALKSERLSAVPPELLQH